MPQVRIRIRGSQAQLHGIEPGRVLPECLTFLHPQRWHNAAFRRKDWDGKVELFSGRIFPAGLAQRVAAYITEVFGEDVEIVEPREVEEVDLQYLTPQYIVDPRKPGFALRPHQLEAIEAVLTNMRGIIKSPTGSGKSEMVIAGARYLWEEFGHRSLIVEPKKGIARQMRERAQMYYEDDIQVGFLGEGCREVGPVTVATAQTLIGFRPRRRKRRTIPADPVLREVVKSFEALWYDECHHSSSDSWYEIGLESHAVRRYGLSGTPLKDEDLFDAKLEGVTGPVIYEAAPDALIDQGFAAKPKIAMVMHEHASGPELPTEIRLVKNPRTGQSIQKKVALPYAKAYVQGVVENSHHNRAVVRSTEWLVDKGRQTIVLCRRKAHFLALAEMFEERGLDFLAVWGDTDNSDRDHAKRLFGDRKINVVLATTIWDEGEDVPNVEAIVLAEGVKTSTNSKQRIGRGMRADSEDVWVVDFVPLCHPKLISHALSRAKAYESEGYETTAVEEWPAPEDDSGDDLLPFERWEEVA